MFHMILVARIYLIFVYCAITAHGQVKFCAVGDILLDRGVKKTTVKFGKEYPFECVKKIIRQHDLAMFNLESPLSLPKDCFPLKKRYSFRGDTEFAEILRNSGFNIASVANNHSIDCGKPALLKTMEYLIKANIVPSGAGENQESALKPAIIVKNGQVTAVFSFLAFLLEATPYNINQAYPAFSDIKMLCDNIRKIRRYVDNVIVSFHWGEENSTKPTSRQIEYAHKVVDIGADLVIGHHPHVLQSIEKYKNKYIFYSLGNFVFDQKKQKQKETVIFTCKLENGNINNVALHPIEIVNSQPKSATSIVGKNIFNSIKGNLINISNIKYKKGLVYIEDYNTKPLKTLFIETKRFAIFQDSIVVNSESGKKKTMRLLKIDASLKDAVGFCKNDTTYIYGIIANEYSNKSRIAVFPYVNKKDIFLSPSLDAHEDFNPWKLNIADVENDGNKELLVGVYKRTRYFNEKEKRVFVYNLQGRYFYPKWFGSKINYTIIDFEVDETNNDLIILHENNQYKPLIRYKWNGFGFSIKDIMKRHADYNEKILRIELLQNMFNYKAYYI